MLIDSCLGLTPLGFHSMSFTVWGNDQNLPPVLCVHGLTRNGRDFDRLAAQLAPSRRVYCPDIVGRGRSDYLADPSLYNYATYLADITALIARTGARQVDWVGTSMGGLIGMMLAAQPQSPIRRLVINDVGPYIPLAGLQRIANYVGLLPEFVDLESAERYLRKNYAPFGITRDEDWQHMAAYGTRMLPNGKLTLAHDPGIARNFQVLKQDVDLWSVYDRITAPTLLIRGKESDILSAETARAMTTRGGKAQLVEFSGVGHAPAIMDTDQIKAVTSFLAA